jgi:hypothetical protein
VVTSELATNGIVTVEADTPPDSPEVEQPAVEQPEVEQPEAVQDPETSPKYPEEYFVVVTQDGDGSPFGRVTWSSVDGADSYQIYKTGSIRPGWRLFWVSPGSATYMNISDEPGSIAIYRVIALVGSESILLGEFEYYPTK